LPLLSRSICNRASGWRATDVEIDFAFVAERGLPTNDYDDYSVARVPPDTCQPFLPSFATLYAHGKPSPPT
jgi:hypothetical protein